MTRRRSRLAAVAALALLVTLVGGCEEQSPVDGTGGVVRLSFGVFGPEPVVAGYQEMVDDWNAGAQSVQVDLLSWPTREAMTADLDAGVDPPDVYLVSRRDLGTVLEQERNVPLFELLEARDVSYGDLYAQPTIEALSADDDLQCMPSTVSPMVVYYNTELVDFAAMRARGLPAPDDPSDERAGWTFEQFATAAAWASRGDARGFSLTPDLASLAPFLLSGGGSLYDDAADPTSLAMSSSENLETLDTVLELLRDPTVTLSDDQLGVAPPMTWFQRGRLGMVLGFRELTPVLREVDGLDFDVMPLPTLDAPATVGDVTGLCIAPGDHVEAAADFLVHAVSDEAVEPLAETGYVVPANLAVSRSDSFLQLGSDPRHAGIFNASVDDMQPLPIVVDGGRLAEAVEPLLEEMLTAPVIDVEELAAAVDEASQSVLDPDYEPDPESSPTDDGSS